MASRKKTGISTIDDDDDDNDDDLEEEPGEVIESVPPMRVGEERPLNCTTGLVKKLLRRGRGWETPQPDDEATVRFVATLVDGTRFDSTRDGDEPLTLKLGQGQLKEGDDGIMTMKEGECALFIVPPELGYGAVGREGVPPNAAMRFEVELISWVRVVDIEVASKGHLEGGE